MTRTDLQDTSAEMHALETKLLREKGPEWRLRKTLELIDWSREMFAEQTRHFLRKEQKAR